MSPPEVKKGDSTHNLAAVPIDFDFPEEGLEESDLARRDSLTWIKNHPGEDIPSYVYFSNRYED